MTAGLTYSVIHQMTAGYPLSWARPDTQGWVYTGGRIDPEFASTELLLESS